MCEASAYIDHGDRQELVLKDVDIIRPEDGQLYLKNIFGEQRRVQAKIKEIQLIEHKIILEKT